MSSDGSPDAAGAAPLAQKNAIRRLHRDLQNLQANPNPQLEVRPLPSNLLEWHFVLHDLPSDTPYHSGCYHGKLVFPPEYPLAPPSIYMITPNGRLELNKRLCLSMTDYHPESWNPAWSTETILVGFLSFFTSDSEKGYGSIAEPAERRRQLARESWQANAASAEFAELFPEFLAPSASSSSSSAAAAAAFLGSAAPPVAEREAEGAGFDLSGIEHAPDSPTPEGATGGTELAALPGPQVPVAEVVAVDGGPDAAVATSSEDGELECWICRDSTDEPLIQPCGCRGSMSSVHASCVEEWIAHHRRTAVNGQAPRCSVCHQVYGGREERPGVGLFARQLCGKMMQVMCRSMVLVILLYVYQVAATDPTKSGVPLWARILMITVFWSAVIHKLLILVISLPTTQQPPPASFLTRWFHEADSQKLGTHIAEAVAGVMILAMWFVAGSLLWPFFVPLAVAMLLPVLKAWQGWSPSLQCLKAIGIFVLFLALFPLILVGMVGHFVYQNPRQTVHPLAAGWHVVVAVASVPLLLACKSNIPVLVLWGSHAVLILGGLVERLVVQRLEWKPGMPWWFALQTAALAACLASDCTFSVGIGAPKDSDLIVAFASFFWVAAVGGLTASVNWQHIITAYRTWQNRNGRFTLDAGGGAAELPLAGNQVAVGDQAV